MQPWYTLPDALYLLDDVARHPPMAIRHTQRFAMTADEWCEYDGHDGRVIRLGQIRDAHLTPILNDRILTEPQREQLCEDAGLMTGVTMAIDAVTGRIVGGSTHYYCEDVAKLSLEIAAAPRRRRAA